MIEREKGGVKLFIGRLPREVTQRQLTECFEEFGDVIEVFIIASQAQSGVGCAFVRLATLEQAENSIADLHEQRILIPDQADLGPMQVAFAKGEAVRLGLMEKEEILPSFREARQKVVEHQEKKKFFEDMQKQQDFHTKCMEHQQALMQQQAMMAEQSVGIPTSELIGLVKDGQRFGGAPFKQKWWSFCDQGWGGTRDYDPSRRPHENLAQFVSIASMEYGHEDWFRKHFEDLPPLPPMPKPPPGGLPPPPPGGPGMPPFGPGGMPPGMLMPPDGPPGMGMGMLMPPGPMGMPGPGGMPPAMFPPGGPPGMPPFPPPPGGMPGMMPPPPGSMPPMGGGGGGRRRSRSGGRGGMQPLPPPPDQAPRKEEDDKSSSSSGSEAGDIEDINADDI